MPKIFNSLILLTLPFQNFTASITPIFSNSRMSLMLVRVWTISKFIGGNGVNQIETWTEGMPRNPCTLRPVAFTDFCILCFITKVLCTRGYITVSWKCTYSSVVFLKINFVKFLNFRCIFIHNFYNKPHKPTNIERSVYYKIIHTHLFLSVACLSTILGREFPRLKIVFFLESKL